MRKRHVLLSMFIQGVLASSLLMAGAVDTTTGSGDGVAVGTGSNAPRAENVAIGKGATISYSNGASAATGDITIGAGAKIDNYASQGGSIAMGRNALVENMTGKQESNFSFGQSNYHAGNWLGTLQIPDNPEKLAGSIAIGDNTYARSGSIMIGSHNFDGPMGDATSVQSSATRSRNINVNATTIGTNSYNQGAHSTITGSYSIITGSYNGSGFSAYATQNLGATITGSLNSIESETSNNKYSGIANTVSGVANRTSNSNGSLIYGAGNEIINSHATLTDVPTSATGTVPEFAEQLRNSVRASNGGGATMILGGGNKADTTRHLSLIGINNTAKNTTNSLVIGDNRTVNNSDHAIIIGTADANKNMTTTANNIIAIGHNSDAQKDNAIAIGDNAMAGESKSLAIGDNAFSSESGSLAIGANASATVEDGIALGAYSKATIAAGAVGYDMTTKTASTNTTPTWKSTAAAVSVGDVDNGLTRQITSVAAGTKDTDAVNVAQLKTVQQQIDTNTSDIKNLTTKVDNHTTTINNHTQQIADNSKRITNNTTNIADNRRLIDANTTAIKSINSNVRQLDNRMNRAVAGAAALAALHPLDFDEHAKWDIAAGYGHYKNGNAAALGAFYRPNEDIQLNIGSTVGNGETVLNAGISVKIGAHDTASVSRKTLTKQVQDLQYTVQTQQQEIEELKDMIRSMR